MDIDFEGKGAQEGGGSAGTQGNNQIEDKTNLHGDDGATALETQPTPAPIEETADATKAAEDNSKGDGDPSTGEIEVGTIVEYDGKSYTVDANKNLVDSDGKVFKTSTEVDAWIKEIGVADDDKSNTEFNLESIQSKVGIEITDESGKPVEFSNDPDGVAAYIDKVIELKQKDIEESTINSLYTKHPVVKDFINYLTVNNGDYTGFGEVVDRSGVVIDEANAAQHEQIIKVAFEEFGRKGNVDAYIKYLKDSGSLLDVAKEELAALQESDKEAKAAREAQAKAIEQAQIEDTAKYWANVKKTIDARVIAGYKIPESFIIERDGRKLNTTPDDFFNYLSRPDAKLGKTGYQSDLDKMSDEEAMSQDLLDAWLKFTGGSYKDLVSIAIKEQEVKKLVLKSKANKTATGAVKITKPTSNKISDIDLG